MDVYRHDTVWTTVCQYRQTANHHSRRAEGTKATILIDGDVRQKFTRRREHFATGLLGDICAEYAPTQSLHGLLERTQPKKAKSDIQMVYKLGKVGDIHRSLPINICLIRAAEWSHADIQVIYQGRQI